MNYIDEKNEKDSTLLLAHNDTGGSQENTWYANTSVGSHMSGNRSMFMELNESTNSNVAFKDDSTVLVKGRGNIFSRKR